MTTFFAEELTAPEFAHFVDARTVGVLPVAAIEPHGPHLPLSTDCDIARGHLAHVAEVVADETNVLILPLQTIGHSLEHRGFAGAFSHSAEGLLRAWYEVAAVFQAAGGRRLIVVSSHGGNSEIGALLVTRLRVEMGMLAVTASWQRFGFPEGVFDPHEPAYGVHGGEIETSLMLHYWPEAVRTDKARDFASAAEGWDAESKELKIHGRIRPGWMTHDLNPLGALGNAAAATAEKGAAAARHQLHGFGELIADVAAFDLDRLGDPG
ncbi:MAG: creatininase family protein [Devosia sp.]|nr:creatininase family protein [Devosia sp.]